eukprot:389253-Pleurochrysis_carterae.AAC.1
MLCFFLYLATAVAAEQSYGLLMAVCKYSLPQTSYIGPGGRAHAGRSLRAQDWRTRAPRRNSAQLLADGRSAW